MRHRLARLAVVSVTAAAIAAPVLPPRTLALAAPGDHLPPITQRDCPSVMTVDEVDALPDGAVGEGLTVSRGTEPEPFDAEIVGVLRDVWPDRDLILAELSSPAIDEAGVWAGMSGSPVYVDGEIIGAVAYGFTWGVSGLAGITPAAEMMDVLDYGASGASVGQSPARITLSAADRRDLAAATQLRVAQVPVSLATEQLRVPLAVSGLSNDRLRRAAEHLRDADLPFITHRAAGGASASASPAEVASIKAGGNYAAALSYGDVTLSGVGTTTLVCDGQAAAFGHPFFWSARTSLSAHAAEALAIPSDAVNGSYKLANVGGVVGRVDQDRLAAITGRLGRGPRTIPLQSSTLIVDGDGMLLRSRNGETHVTQQNWLGELSIYHQWANIDTVRDGYAEGSALLGWTVEGRYRGKRFRLVRQNRYASDVDVSLASVWELYGNLASINAYDGVRVHDVKIRNEVMTEERLFEITGVRVLARGRYRTPRRAVMVHPGGRVRLELVMADQDGRTVRRRLDVRLPRHQRPGRGRITVRSSGGDGEFFDECMFVDCFGGDRQTFAELLRRLRHAPRNDELRVGSSFRFKGMRRPVRSNRVERFGRVVRGSAAVPVVIAPVPASPAPRG